ncbi:MAG: hypothetical protein ACC613_01265 [Synergistales bacterium]
MQRVDSGVLLDTGNAERLGERKFQGSIQTLFRSGETYFKHVGRPGEPEEEGGLSLMTLEAARSWAEGLTVEQYRSIFPDVEEG